MNTLEADNQPFPFANRPRLFRGIFEKFLGDLLIASLDLLGVLLINLSPVSRLDTQRPRPGGCPTPRYPGIPQPPANAQLFTYIEK